MKRRPQHQTNRVQDDSDDLYVESRQLRKRLRRESKRQQQLQQSRADDANRSRNGNQLGQQQQQQRQRARRVLACTNKAPFSDGRGIGAAKQLVKID